MKIRVFFTILGFAFSAASVNAQMTTTSLFGPTAITASPAGASDTDPFTFGTKTVNLVCTTGATGTLSGPMGGNLITDNDILVNGTMICPTADGCFNGTFNDPAQNLGQPVENSYNSVAPIDISSLLVSGLNTFTLRDRGYTYGSSAIELTTTGCMVGYPVCHSSGQNRSKFKTIFVDSQNAVDAHVRNHAGDHAGVCTGNEGARGNRG